MVENFVQYSPYQQSPLIRGKEKKQEKVSTNNNPPTKLLYDQRERKEYYLTHDVNRILGTTENFNWKELLLGMLKSSIQMGGCIGGATLGAKGGAAVGSWAGGPELGGVVGGFVGSGIGCFSGAITTGMAYDAIESTIKNEDFNPYESAKGNLSMSIGLTIGMITGQIFALSGINNSAMKILAGTTSGTLTNLAPSALEAWKNNDLSLLPNWKEILIVAVASSIEAFLSSNVKISQTVKNTILREGIAEALSTTTELEGRRFINGEEISNERFLSSILNSFSAAASSHGIEISKNLKKTDIEAGIKQGAEDVNPKVAEDPVRTRLHEALSDIYSIFSRNISADYIPKYESFAELKKKLLAEIETSKDPEEAKKIVAEMSEAMDYFEAQFKTLPKKDLDKFIEKFDYTRSVNPNLSSLPIELQTIYGERMEKAITKARESKQFLQLSKEEISFLANFRTDSESAKARLEHVYNIQYLTTNAQKQSLGKLSNDLNRIINGKGYARNIYKDSFSTSDIKQIIADNYLKLDIEFLSDRIPEITEVDKQLRKLEVLSKKLSYSMKPTEEDIQIITGLQTIAKDLKPEIDRIIKEKFVYLNFD